MYTESRFKLKGGHSLTSFPLTDSIADELSDDPYNETVSQ
jgi:hypothetical protein